MLHDRREEKHNPKCRFTEATRRILLLSKRR